MHKKLEEISNCALIIKQMTGADAAIAVWNKDAVVEAYFKSDKVNINFGVGYKDDTPNSNIKEVLRTGKPSFNKVPKEVFGQAFEGTITPIFDGSEVVGAVTYVYPSDTKDDIISNADSLANSLKETTSSLGSIVESTKDLSTHMNQVKDITNSVSTKVDEAIEIVTSIQHNAKLSNILALNASIESARAGEAGKGFAVVSGEMRKFSKISSEASDKISSSLNDIVTLLSDAKKSIDSSDDIVKEQTESVNELNTIFNDVNEKANKTIEVCKNITTI